jgi:hypothetical protein
MLSDELVIEITSFRSVIVQSIETPSMRQPSAMLLLGDQLLIIDQSIGLFLMELNVPQPALFIPKCCDNLIQHDRAMSIGASLSTVELLKCNDCKITKQTFSKPLSVALTNALSNLPAVLVGMIVQYAVPSGLFLGYEKVLSGNLFYDQLSGYTPKFEVAAGKGHGFLDGDANTSSFFRIESILVTSDDRHLYLADMSNQAIRHLDRLTNTVDTIAQQLGLGNVLDSVYTLAWDATVPQTGFYYTTDRGVWRYDVRTAIGSIIIKIPPPTFAYGLVCTPCGILILSMRDVLFYVNPRASCPKTIPFEPTITNASKKINRLIFGLALDAKRCCLYVAEASSMRIHKVTLDPRLFR